MNEPKMVKIEKIAHEQIQDLCNIDRRKIPQNKIHNDKFRFRWRNYGQIIATLVAEEHEREFGKPKTEKAKKKRRRKK